MLKTILSVHNNHLNLSAGMKIHSDYCEVEKQVLNVGIKDY